MDIVSIEKRSKMMAGIRNRNTRPELFIRKMLHRNGFRFRLHSKRLPGNPDIILPKYEAVIFVHGCFWHRHNCHLFKWPKTRSEFWKSKIESNFCNDLRVKDRLLSEGWRVCIVWECAIKGKRKRSLSELSSSIEYWLRDDTIYLEVSGSKLEKNKQL